ncbi:MAG: pilus assembly protein PilM [Phycisphaerales bacterium]|nr:MAG: pilus assembly protein PilM [Phycisphaerales bacterium]
MWSLKTNRSPIGIDLSGRCMRAVQLSRGIGRWRLEAVASVPRLQVDAALSEPDAQRLWEVLGRRNFAGAKAVIGLPEKALASALIKAPREGSAQSRDEFICDEFARASSLDLRRSEMAYWELPAPSRGDNTVDVMAVGCAHADAEELLDAAESAGLEVVALDASSAAVARWLSCLSGRPAMTAVVDVEWNSAGVVVVHHDTVVYERAISDARLAMLYEELKRRKGLTEEMFDLLLQEAGVRDEIDGNEWADGASNVRKIMAAHFDRMARELKTALSYVDHQYREETEVDSCVIGDGSRIAGLSDHLSQQLGVKVNPAPASENVECPGEHEKLGTSAAFAKAVGFALHGV